MLHDFQDLIIKGNAPSALIVGILEIEALSLPLRKLTNLTSPCCEEGK